MGGTTCGRWEPLLVKEERRWVVGKEKIELTKSKKSTSEKENLKHELKQQPAA